jgi:ribosome biogenesis GTPase A
MAASLRGLEEYIKQCDVILYVLDARCPKSCINPSFETFTRRKPVVFVLNKFDLSVPTHKPSFLYGGVCIDSTRSGAAQKVLQKLRHMFPTKTRVYAMVVGVPNSGKSTLINNFAGSAKAKTENRAGVTRQPQWVEAASNGGIYGQAMLGGDTKTFSLFLLDTPGILWPNLEDQQVAHNLAFVGSIKDDVLDIVEIARALLVKIRYLGTLEDFARRRGHILRGNEVDLNRAARAVLGDFRSGKFGKYNLDEM